jgi:hypothetical protein
MFSAATKSARGSNAAVNYIEDVFSTWLYTGTGAAQTITNNIDLSTKGGLTWIKSRSDATNNNLFDTAQGATKLLHSNRTDATATDAVSLTSFNSTGFTLGTGSTASNEVNVSAATYCSWSFRKQPKFFDVVTYTGNGTASQTISHNLGSTPGFIVLKTTSGSTSQWFCWHKDYTGPGLYLNSPTLYPSDPQIIGTTPTSTSFVVNDAGINMNAVGYTYVVYLFASNAGGFGLTGTDNVISCGTFTTDASGNATVNLGYEPQFAIMKSSVDSGTWIINDIMRGADATGTTAPGLFPNTAAAESTNARSMHPNATGFVGRGVASTAYIYMAIRRPMKVPTDATTVFKPALRTGTSADATVTGIGFPSDLVILGNRTIINTRNWWSRLIGASQYLDPTSTTVEQSSTDSLISFNMDGISLGVDSTNTANYTGSDFVNYYFKRAAGFFDQVCYTGTGANTTQTHNLTTAPQLMFVKARSATPGFQVYSSSLANTEYLVVSSTAAKATDATRWNSTTPTSTVFSLGTNSAVNASTTTYTAWLFATCAGVSKVGTYTGNGTTQAIACGFTGGARFVLIKRTDAVGNWYVYDTARGMTTVTDPYLLFNSAVAETASLGSVTTTTGGFTVNAAILAAINTSAATYIFLAIA